jgi:DNA mismatch repair ATPase MutL
MGQITETSGSDGTDVRVEMLFYNVPVRLKFLKSDKTEESNVTTFVSHLICSRPDIAFTYYVDGKKVLQSFGGGMEEAFVSVYGAATLNNCYQIDAQKHGVRIRGFIGNPNYSKPNKSYQTVFINGRYVSNLTVSLAVGQAYQSYLMKRQYPFYVLYIDLPTEIVDVNVHPNKTEVRFMDNGIVFGCLKGVLSAVLDGQPKGLEYLVKHENLQSLEPLAEEKTNLLELLPKEKPTEENKEKTAQDEALEFSFLYEQAKKEVENSPLRKTRLNGDVPFPEKPMQGFTPIEQVGKYVPSGKKKAKNPENFPPLDKSEKPLYSVITLSENPKRSRVKKIYGSILA